VICASLFTGGSHAKASTSPGDISGSLPANVTVEDSVVLPPRLPEDLIAASARLAGLVDFHDSDFSGSWYDTSDQKLHIGVATPVGRALLDKKGLAHDSNVVIERADRSLLEGQRFARAYVRHSTLGQSIVGWGTLPQGDGIDLSVRAHHLTPAELEDLARLPVRVVVTLGVTEGENV
jgi:hypothetical protein